MCCGHYFAAALQIDRDHSGLIEREEFEDALREMKKSEVRFHSVACLPPGHAAAGCNGQHAASSNVTADGGKPLSSAHTAVSAAAALP